MNPEKKNKGPAAWWAGLSPAERSARARVAALGRTDNGARRTEKARSAFKQKLYDQTDPALPPAERQRLADQAMRQHLERMRVKSMAARRRATAAAHDAELADALLADAISAAEA